MVTILISELPNSYTHFLKSFQITCKLENTTFNKLNELVVNHEKMFRKKKQLGEDVLVASTRKTTTRVSNGKGVLPTRNNDKQQNLNQYSNQGRGNVD
jgi:hypothetical protein